jgi:hypothetical protein
MSRESLFGLNESLGLKKYILTIFKYASQEYIKEELNIFRAIKA